MKNCFASVPRLLPATFGVLGIAILFGCASDPGAGSGNSVSATGGHAFIVPALIGAAVAYAVSGDASTSADQRVHEERIRYQDPHAENE